jgi:predicted Fe-S protein YdhL (DUF1289 family)
MISPCIKVCKVKSNICIGCKRTITEIANWVQYTDQQRMKIMMDLKQR